MATSTFNPALAGHTGNQRQATGFFAKLGKQFVAQRIEKARQMTADTLTMYTDKQLESFGWSPEDIKRLRNRA